ncbi:MAG: helix-turn-helix transcriptional regulator [Bacteroidota bacterium]
MYSLFCLLPHILALLVAQHTGERFATKRTKLSPLHNGNNENILYFRHLRQDKYFKTMKETFGEYIHNLRVEHSLTLTKLAAALDLDQSTLSKIENQKRSVPAEILPKLANIFKLDIKKLEKEFYSEKIAELIYHVADSSELLTLAEEKAKYYRTTKAKQGNLKL